MNDPLPRVRSGRARGTNVQRRPARGVDRSERAERLTAILVEVEERLAREDAAARRGVSASAR